MSEFPLGDPQSSQSTRAAFRDPPAAGRAERERRYRTMGWWSGERSCDRYAVLAQRYENRLAVADPTGRRIGHGRLWREGGRRAEKPKAGDLARIDAHGYVRITGRLKDPSIRGGVDIPPVPIENALADRPRVSAVAVIGHPDERLGECIRDVVAPDGEAPSLDDLVAHARLRRLPKHHCPEVPRTVDTMPKTPAGNIRKADLRAVVTGDVTGPGEGA